MPFGVFNFMQFLTMAVSMTLNLKLRDYSNFSFKVNFGGLGEVGGVDYSFSRWDKQV